MKERKKLLIQLSREVIQFIGFALAIAGAVIFVSPAHYAALFNNSTYPQIVGSAWLPSQVLLLGALLSMTGLVLIVKPPLKKTKTQR
ncbi:MAG: hypothetical protein ABSE39_00510 [Candidatus Bathyarchaeia archaeon]|jgi:hypothetical protein